MPGPSEHRNLPGSKPDTPDYQRATMPDPSDDSGFGDTGDRGDYEGVAPGGLPGASMQGMGYFMPGEAPDGAGLPSDMVAPPRISIRPYVGRALRLLGAHRALLVSTLLLAFVTTLLPFIYSAAFGPLIELLGRVALDPKGWNGVWGMTGSLFSKADSGNLNALEAWLATPFTFTALFIIWAAAMVLSYVTEFLRTVVESQLERRMLTDVRQQVYEHVQSLSLDHFSRERTGALMERILTESGGVVRILTQLVNPLVDVVVLVIAFAYLIGLSWQMTLVAFALAPFALLMLRYTSRKLQQASIAMMLSGRDLSTELEETISGIADIQVFNAQPKRSARFLAASSAAARYTSEILIWVYATASGSQIFIALSTALVLLVGILFGARFGLTIASLIVFVQFVPQMFAPVQRLVRSWSDYQAAAPSVAATYELLDTAPTIVEQPSARDLGEIHGNISFQGVTFGYAETGNILDAISFDIHEGETVAFVGPIGCGKTTILNLLMRFLDPQAGRILLDGVDISGVTLNSLREQVSKLSQFPFFLKDTIAENVRLGRADATDQEVDDACRLAHIHDVIQDKLKMPDGYETIVDVQVPSGGQKRLIALARCLLRKPEVLLLDEPTENLDADQRMRLIRVIREYARERTCLVVSHDLSFVAAVADRILVVNKGQIADQGTHDELLQREGLYKTLFELKNIDPALLRVRDAGDGSTQPPAFGAMPEIGI